MTSVLAIRSTTEGLEWVFVSGESRGDAGVLRHRRIPAPEGDDRGAQLVWIRREVLEVIDTNGPDVVVFRPLEPSARNIVITRAEADGVIQEAIASVEIKPRRVYKATMFSAFEVKRNDELARAGAILPSVSGAAQAWQDLVFAALVPLER